MTLQNPSMSQDNILPPTELACRFFHLETFAQTSPGTLRFINDYLENDLQCALRVPLKYPSQPV